MGCVVVALIYSWLGLMRYFHAGFENFEIRGRLCVGFVDKGAREIVSLWVEFSLCEDCSGLQARLRSLYPENRIVYS